MDDGRIDSRGRGQPDGRNSDPSGVVSPPGTIVRPLKRVVVVRSSSTLSTLPIVSGQVRAGQAACEVRAAMRPRRINERRAAAATVARRGFISQRDYDSHPPLSGDVLAFTE